MLYEANNRFHCERTKQRNRLKHKVVFEVSVESREMLIEMSVESRNMLIEMSVIEMSVESRDMLINISLLSTLKHKVT